jgi:hypothetical protein
MTVPGIVNIVGMLLFLVLTLTFALPPVLELVYRVLRDLVRSLFGVQAAEETTDVPILQVLVVYGAFMLACVLILGYLGSAGRRHRR